MSPEDLMTMLLDLSENPDNYVGEMQPELEWITPGSGTPFERLSEFLLGVNRPSDFSGFNVSETMQYLDAFPPSPVKAGVLGIPRALGRAKEISGAVQDGVARVKMNFDPRAQEIFRRHFGDKAVEKGTEVAADMFPRRLRNIDYRPNTGERMLMFELSDFFKSLKQPGDDQ